MRIAYVGNVSHPWSTETDYRLAFEAEGHDVIGLQENNVSYSEIRRQALQSDLLLVTSTWDSALPYREMLTTFYLCAKAGIPTATVHLDCFWPVSRGGRQWWNEWMFRTGTVFSADGDHDEQWKALGVNHHWLPAAVRHTVVEQEYEARPEFECDVAFVGSDGIGYHEGEWPYRRELINKLEEICKRNKWLFLNPGGRQKKIERQDMGDFYMSARVTVGDSLCLKREQARYWSDRVYECTGRGGFLIMPRIDALAEGFLGALPTYDWGDWVGLERAIEIYLGSDSSVRDRIASQCKQITADHNTYRHRVRTILETVGYVPLH